MVITGGEHVYPEEVENVLARAPSVDRVAVVGMPDEICRVRKVHQSEHSLGRILYQANGRLRMDLRRRCAIHEAGHAVAALAYAIPLVSITIAADRPHLHRGHYHPLDVDFGLECMVTLCLAGPEAEREFCGSISDDSDRTDYEMARDYLSRQFGPLQIGAELARFRDAAQRRVRSPWAQRRIVAIADALLQRGSLSAEQIFELGANKQKV